MAKLLIISNGHGEDLSGARLGKALGRYGHEVVALPLVGIGRHYKQESINLLQIRVKEFTTGGIGYTSLKGRFTELIQGQICYLLKKIYAVISTGRNYDMIIAVGDVIPVFTAWLSRRPVVTYLVAYSSHYEGRLTLPFPCKRCLTSKRFLGVFSRDELTSLDLTKQLNKPVSFLGNPFMDKLLISDLTVFSTKKIIGILPGSRKPELAQNLVLILLLIEVLGRNSNLKDEFIFKTALVSSLSDLDLSKIATEHNWKLIFCNKSSNIKALKKGDSLIHIHRDSFNQVLIESNLIISMAGTAAEQAVGLAKPVVQLLGKGPQFTKSFAEAQRRLLGPTVFCGEGEAASKTNLKSTAELILHLIKRIDQDPSLHNKCQYEARRRLGGKRGGSQIAKKIDEIISHKLSYKTKKTK